MATHDLHLDEATFALALQMAKERNVSVEALITSAIDQLRAAPAEANGTTELIGAMADYAEVLDEAVADAYRNRALQPDRIRVIRGG